jgi:hypothetical protein
MLLRPRAFAVVLVAVAALGATWAQASAVQPASHHFVKGEHFRYANVLSLGSGEGTVVIDRSKTMTAVDDIEVVDVSASATMLADHVEYEKETGFPPTTTYIRMGADGRWRYADGRVGGNVVTWDSVQFGPQPPALAVGQQWQLDVPSTATFKAGRATVRVVSVDPDNLVLHVEGKSAPSSRGSIRVTHKWYTDVTFVHGIVHELHRVDLEHWERGSQTRAFDNRTDSQFRLVAHTTP